ncbi:hypothetical protein CHC07_03283 [Variovorax sp. B4]|nr:hypothetical protein CHC06_04236 [Variovorax sp. B2]PNG53468.1 hypothetical protein CHC07_03283 [Variovorax sp. B4]
MFTAVRLCVPPATVRPPAPLMMPSKVPLALDSASVWPPSKTLPLPPRVETVAPLLPLMSKIPSFLKPREVEMLPALPSASVAPLWILVSPV